MGSGNSKNTKEIKKDSFVTNYTNITLSTEEKEKIPINSIKRLECQVPKNRIDNQNINTYKFKNGLDLNTEKLEDNSIPNNEILIKDLPDRRAEVLDSSKYPYCCIGLVTGKYLDQVASKHISGQKIKIVEGTGALISPKHVLTCAHNVYNSEIKYEYFDLVFHIELDKPYF